MERIPNRIGKLNQIEGNHVLIDATWYVALKPQYIPRDIGAEVEYGIAKNDPSTVTFIKKIGGVTTRDPQPSLPPENGGYNGPTTTTKPVKGNYSEVRRESNINSAIEYVKSQNLRVTIAEIIQIAETIENWVIKAI